MADVSHLERMGRELKCPICLSLLNTAVSLTCNHVFCNTCMEKSMKSALNCPVCKIPYRRREIRPAHHMDNLVSVYKSMEEASGVTILVTQNEAPNKISGEDDQTGCISEGLDICKSRMANLDSENHKQYQLKGSKRTSIINETAFGSNTAKPSFPAKKRVQVPPYPTSETQRQSEKVVGGIDRKDPKTDAVLHKDMTSLCEKRETNFSPFFWLREEEDLDKLSPQTDGDQDMHTPPEAPCFSDIKESDDDVPCKINRNEASTFSNCADFFDSEMFDWTQRPCSPELCSSPQTMQIDDTAEDNGGQENAEPAPVEATAYVKSSPTKVKSMGKRSTGKISGNKRAMKMSNKRFGNAIDNTQRKKTRRTEITAVRVESRKMTNTDMPENSSSKDKLLNVEGKTRKSSAKKASAEFFLTQHDGTEPHANNNRISIVDCPASQNVKESSEGSQKSKKTGINGNKIKKTMSNEQRSGGKVKAGKHQVINDQGNEEQQDEILISPSNNNLLPLGIAKEVSDGEVTSKNCERSCKITSRSLKKVKFTLEGMSKDNSGNVSASALKKAAVRGETLEETQGRTNPSGMKTLAKTDNASPTLNAAVLLRCKTLPSEIHCVFCQSSKDSEASGMMVHYLNGKLVTDTNITRSNVVHVHKYCAEWAPNVYFEDDTVVNLENELLRSRRIRCSCCGKKGAALGCYEKSCRKSFHVPCARLTPTCRWDYENFVMLCPCHASCQLPNEMTKSRSKQRRKSAAESKSQQNIAKATDECRSTSILQLKSQKGFKNLVLCCSALSNTEKDTVKEFKSLSGVTTLKNWDSTVTHVIASTDENGACRRTLKFLMGVLEGKWILTIKWLNACMTAGELVDEQPYVIAVDIHGIRDGPRLGRLRIKNKQPKLFDGCKFFFMGDFAPSYKGYLHDLVIAAGGKVLNRRPIVEHLVGTSTCSGTTYIIYSLELPEKRRPSDASSFLNNRRHDAEAVASSTSSVVVSNLWILNSIAGHKLQNIRE